MGSKWKKAKVSLGKNLCMLVPSTLDDDSPLPTVVSERFSDAALLSTAANWDMGSSRPTTPVPSFYGLKLSKSSSKSSKQTCPICLTRMNMAGTKLALLKRAMGFVIQNLGSNDRLSVIAFSSTARRLFPLCRMTDSGRQQALQAVNSLVANGGTNIAEGLRKGAKIVEDRKEKNPVASIILLSDGQDNYTVNGSGSDQPQPNYQLLLPTSISGCDSFQVPVHAFGFGTDHDALSMHSISEASGGTFSFIETEFVLQDAFAQCIGGLLSVIVQELQVGIECIHQDLCLVSIKAGSYPSRVMATGREGFIDVGDLYADEGRDFLVSVNVPATSDNETSLIKVKCFYKDPLTQETMTLESEEVKIERPGTEVDVKMSLEVDRQRNRLQAAEAMAQARFAAEQGNLTGAVSILENCRKMLSGTVSAKSLDRLCIALDAELKEMQERMVSRHVYEASGRAYILSGLSSHSWQRATARSDSTDRLSLVQSYQTPSMAKMLTRSQAMSLGSSSGQRLLQPLLSYRSQPSPR
ncbi:putative VWA-Hint protein, Vwaint [Lupinus albus]|uniref:Putative VWA-Hint protein, Vwaint n=1 Tax=Lupinus albus TaxID=3870 RepID=A0A6A4NNG8_LUPAL|nr:putative VWA-Hint protein, Vwaint [Lupinus albus]